MELYRYKVFTTVVECGNFTKAAEQLYITPSAVSHTINNLEKDLGFPLFIRNKSFMELTENGKNLLPHFYNMMKIQEHIDQEAKKVMGINKGTVRLGSFNSVTMKWLPDIIKNFREKYPNIEIKLFQGKYSDVVSGIKTGMLDMGFVTTTTEFDSEITPLYEDELLCVTPKSFVPKNKKFVTVEEIRDMDIIMQAEGLASDTKEFLDKNQIKTNSRISVADDSSLVALVAAEFGCSIMPSLLFTDEVDSRVSLYPIKPKSYRTIGLITVRDQFISPAALKMKDEIMAFAADYK